MQFIESLNYEYLKDLDLKELITAIIDNNQNGFFKFFISFNDVYFVYNPHANLLLQDLRSIPQVYSEIMLHEFNLVEVAQKN